MTRKPGGEVDRRLAAANVEPVHRGEVAWLEPVWVLARPPERVEHRTLENPVRVMLRHRFFGSHELPRQLVRRKPGRLPGSWRVA